MIPKTQNCVKKTKYSLSASLNMNIIKILNYIIILTGAMECVINMRFHISYASLETIHTVMKPLLASTQRLLAIKDMPLVMLNSIKEIYDFIPAIMVVLILFVNYCLNKTNLNLRFEGIKQGC